MRTTRLPLSILMSVYFIVLAFWTIYRSNTQLPEYIDELLAKPLIWVSPVVLVMLWKKIKFSTLGFSLPNLKVILISVVTGLALSLLQIVPNFFKGSTKINNFDTQSFLVLILIYLGTAISEEVLFRGFILQQLRQKFSSFTSITLSSFSFALIHLPILLWVNKLSGLDLIFGLYVIFVSGVVFGILFLRFKNIWSPIIAHLILNILLTIF